MQGKVALRLVTLLLWLLAAGSVVYWGLRFVQSPSAPPQAQVVQNSITPAAVETAAVARALGGGRQPTAAAAAPSAAPSIQASRFVLTGVVTGRSPLALIAVDGKPARPVRQGSSVTDGVILQSVDKASVVLASSAQATDGIKLALPVLASAIVGNVVPVRPATPVVAQAAPAAAPAPAPLVSPPSISVVGSPMNIGNTPTGAPGAGAPGGAPQSLGRGPASRQRAGSEPGTN
jgi:general secretion pathway protein C